MDFFLNALRALWAVFKAQGASKAANELPPVGGKLQMTAAFGIGSTVHHAREAVQRAKANKYGVDGQARDSVSA